MESRSGELEVNTKELAQGCEWYINSEIDDYCFWNWVSRMSDEEGFMEPLTQSEIGKLLGLSSTKVSEAYKSALEKLKTLPDHVALLALFSE